MAEGTGAAPDLHLLAARDRTDGSTASRLDGVDGDLDWMACSLFGWLVRIVAGS